MNKEKTDAPKGLSMTATWKKQVKAESQLIYLEINYLEKREDVQAFLRNFAEGKSTYKGEHAALVQERLVKYFQDQGLLDGNQLTPEGQQALDSGQVQAREIGKYRIWWLPSAPLLQGRIVYFERFSADTSDTGQNKIGHTSLGLSKDQHFKLSREKQPVPLRFDITQSGNAAVQPDFVESIGGRSNINILWRWEGLTINHISLSGDIQTGKENLIHFDAQKLSVAPPVDEYLHKVFPNWDTLRQRLRISHKGLSISILRDFTKDFNFEQAHGFDSIEFSRVPLMPLDLEHAQSWRDSLLVDALQATYLSKEAWQAQCDAVQRHAAFEDYPLASPAPDAFLLSYYGQINSAQRGADFWHLAAPLDLFPTAIA